MPLLWASGCPFRSKFQQDRSELGAQIGKALAVQDFWNLIPQDWPCTIEIIALAFKKAPVADRRKAF